MKNLKKNNKKNKKAISKLRIIAGVWRSRVIEFNSEADLRPTSDRIRETLFNWLAPTIVQASCLDLFAGTGILSFESISRGATEVTAVEKNSATIKKIKENQAILQDDKINIVEEDVVNYLNQETQSYDVIFLDPPYANKVILIDCLNLIAKKNILNNDGLIYFETNENIEDKINSGFEILKHKKAGQVHYYLATMA